MIVLFDMNKCVKSIFAVKSKNLTSTMKRIVPCTTLRGHVSNSSVPVHNLNKKSKVLEKQKQNIKKLVKFSLTTSNYFNS